MIKGERVPRRLAKSQRRKSRSDNQRILRTTGIRRRGKSKKAIEARRTTGDKIARRLYARNRNREIPVMRRRASGNFTAPPASATSVFPLTAPYLPEIGRAS